MVEKAVDTTANWETRAMVVGAIIGALVGLGGAYLFIQSAQRRGGDIKITAGDAVKLGIFLMGTLRQVAELGD
jgi:hypothetical protein